MISLDDVREETLTVFKAVHDAYHPTVLVNYPNFVVVDIENQEDPFVSVELSMVNSVQAAMGEREILVPGTLTATYYFREGKGLSSAYVYTDTLNNYIGMTQVGALYFHAVQPMDVQTFPGWKGVMNSIRFDVVKELLCQS